MTQLSLLTCEIKDNVASERNEQAYFAGLLNSSAARTTCILIHRQNIQRVYERL